MPGVGGQELNNFESELGPVTLPGMSSSLGCAFFGAVNASGVRLNHYCDRHARDDLQPDLAGHDLAGPGRGGRGAGVINHLNLLSSSAGPEVCPDVSGSLCCAS
jgi:hypothetical protein